MHRGTTCALAALVVFASACSSGDAAPNTDPSPSETASSSPTPTEEPTSESPTPTASDTTAGDDLSQVPDEITVEYLDRVMAEVDRVYAEAFQLARDTGDATAGPVLEHLSTVYTADNAHRELSGFDGAVGTEGLADPVKPPETSVTEILDVTENCVLFMSQHTVAPMLSEGIDFETPNPYYVQLVTAPSTNAAPLPWTVALATGFVDPAPATCADADDIVSRS